MEFIAPPSNTVIPIVGPPVKIRLFDIGPWNLLMVPSLDIDITGVDVTKVISLNAVLRGDTPGMYWPFPAAMSSAPPHSLSRWWFNSANVLRFVLDTGHYYRSGIMQSTSFSRGYVTIIELA